MKISNTYLKYVRWSDEDNLYIGYCPDLFPSGGVCHSSDEEDCYHQLCVIVEDVVDTLVQTKSPLPEALIRPMSEVFPVGLVAA